jgi:hypothetical protein
VAPPTSKTGTISPTELKCTTSDLEVEQRQAMLGAPFDQRHSKLLNGYLAYNLKAIFFHSLFAVPKLSGLRATSPLPASKRWSYFNGEYTTYATF